MILLKSEQFGAKPIIGHFIEEPHLNDAVIHNFSGNSNKSMSDTLQF